MVATHAQDTLITLTSVRVPLCHVQAKQGHGYPIQKLEECLSSLDKVATAMALNEKELKRAGSHGKAGSSTHFLAPLKPGCLCIYVRVRVRVRVLVLVRTPCLCSLCCFCTKTQTQTPIYSWTDMTRTKKTSVQTDMDTTTHADAVSVPMSACHTGFFETRRSM